MDKLLTTQTLAKLLCVKASSIYMALYRKGEYLGVTPIKLPNGRLLWRKKEIDNLLTRHK